MISFFRRALTSWPVLALLALIGVAFVVTSFDTGSGIGGFGGSTGSVAQVDGVAISESDAARRVNNQVDIERQRQPGFDMGALVASGGVERVVDLMIDDRAMTAFAQAQGMVVSRRAVDGEIASIPAFNGADGKFDRNTFLGLLANRRITERDLREDFERGLARQALSVPISGGTRAPSNLAAPYAALLLERRQGLVTAVPSNAFAGGPMLTDAELATFYRRNLPRYTLPERRIVRYAFIDRRRFASLQATDTEIASAYAADRAKYAGREQRSFTQVIVPQQARANEIAGRIRSGATLEAAAGGLDPLKVAAIDRAGFAALTGAKVADAAFAAAQGGVASVERSGLGFHVVRVDDVSTIAPTPLSAVRATIASEVTKAKTDRALADLIAKIEDEVAENATIEEVAKRYALQLATTPAVTVGGLSPDVPGYQPPPTLAPVLRDAFQGDPDDDPVLTTIVANDAYALWKLDRVVASAAQPLSQVREQALLDARADRASAAARKAADAVASSINAGTPFAQSLARAGVPLPAPRPLGARRLELAQAREGAPPPLALMFSMVAKRAKILEMPNKQGWFIVYLDSIARGDLSGAPQMLAATQAQLAQVMGQEYVQQFVRAVRRDVGAARDDAGLKRLKASLNGVSGAR